MARPAPSGGWSYWVVWVAVVCVVGCGGDWDTLDERLPRDRSGGVMRGAYLAPLRSHLQDPRERLAADGLDAAELAGGAARDPKVVARACAKVWKQSLEGMRRRRLRAGVMARSIHIAAHGPRLPGIARFGSP
ncbi:hypothetical protein [Streptomyces griseorubiginosus]|uniref:hypothetical protein n=1 Tax=Streptomyces griseorubiginosus TaxID=67304 RepID=UPI001AD7CD26|nr:hypothetical protein [Streptomyces griseorubiginosus]MBO4253462.1 hypothetical protein [Streptomyces griseorubiginosus]